MRSGGYCMSTCGFCSGGSATVASVAAVATIETVGKCSCWGGSLSGIKC